MVCQEPLLEVQAFFYLRASTLLLLQPCFLQAGSWKTLRSKLPRLLSIIARSMLALFVLLTLRYLLFSKDLPNH